jgi:hypothetical protein
MTSAEKFYQLLSKRHGITPDQAKEISIDLLKASCFKKKADKRFIVEVEVPRRIELGYTVTDSLAYVCREFDIDFNLAKFWHYRMMGMDQF